MKFNTDIYAFAKLYAYICIEMHSIQCFILYLTTAAPSHPTTTLSTQSMS